MKKIYAVLFFLMAAVLPSGLYSQNSNVGVGTTTPDASSILDVTSTSKGVLVPRLTTAQRNAIANPAASLLVYDTDLGCFYYYNATTTAWVSLCQAGPAGPTGPQGTAGVAGASGSNGVTGPTGPSGADGAPGAAGAPGPAGAAGAAGANGAQGAPGAPGAAGSNGATGATGPTGPGGTGSLGPTGPQGITGATGPQGVAGANGAAGATGPAGAAGPSGAAGATGPSGTAGSTGATGPTGTAGFVASNVISLVSGGGTNPTILSYTTGANVVYTQLPNLTYTTTLATASKIVVLAFGSCSRATETYGTIYAQYAVFLDGVNTGTIQRVSIEASTYGDVGYYYEVPWSISTVLSVAAGTHTISIQGTHAGGDGIAPNDKIWICTPSGYVGQAQMNILITQ